MGGGWQWQRTQVRRRHLGADMRRSGGGTGMERNAASIMSTAGGQRTWAGGTARRHLGLIMRSRSMGRRGMQRSGGCVGMQRSGGGTGMQRAQAGGRAVRSRGQPGGQKVQAGRKARRRRALHGTWSTGVASTAGVRRALMRQLVRRRQGSEAGRNTDRRRTQAGGKAGSDLAADSWRSRSTGVKSAGWQKPLGSVRWRRQTRQMARARSTGGQRTRAGGGARKRPAVGMQRSASVTSTVRARQRHRAGAMARVGKGSRGRRRTRGDGSWRSGGQTGWGDRDGGRGRLLVGVQMTKMVSGQGARVGASSDGMCQAAGYMPCHCGRRVSG